MKQEIKPTEKEKEKIISQFAALEIKINEIEARYFDKEFIANILTTKDTHNKIAKEMGVKASRDEDKEFAGIVKEKTKEYEQIIFI